VGFIVFLSVKIRTEIPVPYIVTLAIFLFVFALVAGALVMIRLAWTSRRAAPVARRWTSSLTEFTQWWTPSLVKSR
jgi:hypothetical protein